MPTHSHQVHALTYTHALTLTCILLHGWSHTHSYLIHMHTYALMHTHALSTQLATACHMGADTPSLALCQHSPRPDDCYSGGLRASTVGLPILCQVLATLRLLIMGPRTTCLSPLEPRPGSCFPRVGSMQTSSSARARVARQARDLSCGHCLTLAGKKV